MSIYKVKSRSFDSIITIKDCDFDKEKSSTINTIGQITNFTTTTALPATTFTLNDCTVTNSTFIMNAQMVPIPFITSSWISVFFDNLYVHISAENFNTHSWNVFKCSKCDLNYENKDGKLKAEKNISCNENKLSRLLG